MNEIHDSKRLAELQALPLQRKIGFTAARITEWYNHYEGKVCVSFSGGKDSTVLLHIARKLYPDIKAVYCDTGLEYPEIKEFVKTFDNVDIVRPKMSFKQVIEKEGYPVISKEVSEFIAKKKTGMPCMERRWAYCRERESNCLREGKDPFWYGLLRKWYKLEDAPFKISNKCCEIMKKTPMNEYNRRNKLYPMIGTLAAESRLRMVSWYKNGCNAFDSQHPHSTPLAFWTTQNILEYLSLMQIPIASVYGEIVRDYDGKLKTTGQERTGCMYCLFGIHREKSPNRIQRIAKTHPKIYKYILDKLGFRAVMDYLKIPYAPCMEQGELSFEDKKDKQNTMDKEDEQK